MKKLKLLLILICLSTITKSQIHFGVKAGLNLANIKFDSTGNSSYKSGLNVGVLVSIPLTKSLSLQPEVMLSQQGYGYKINDTSYKAYFPYFLLPVLLKYSLMSGVYAETGPQFGLLLDNKFYDIKSSDFSWVFGIGYKLPMNLGIDLRYTLGISNIEKYSTYKAYNSVFQFDLFYLFGK